MGTPRFAVPSLERLAGGPHRVVAAVCQPDRPAGRGRIVRAPAVKAVASQLGVPVLQPARAKDPGFIAQVRLLEPDLCVVVAYGQILPRALIDVPRFGCINAHASLLPRWRGAAPIQRAILAGDSETGVTIMQINERMDAGDVLASRRVTIEPEDDAQTLAIKLAAVAADLLENTVSAVSERRAVATPQDEAEATYAPMIRSEERQIDWSVPADAVERRVRAFRPDPGAFTLHDGSRLKILGCEVESALGTGVPGTVKIDAHGEPIVICGAAGLRLVTVQPEGGRPMAAADYFRGRGATRARFFASA